MTINSAFTPFADIVTDVNNDFRSWDFGRSCISGYIGNLFHDKLLFNYLNKIALGMRIK